MSADRVYWLHALSPLHVGAGRGEGYIDLPLAREKTTGLPYVPGSSVKGVLADRHGATNEERDRSGSLVAKAFGRAGKGAEDPGHAGALVFTDARLVCLPVRSLYGTFAWATSRLVLKRLRRDLKEAKLPAIPPDPPADANLAARVPNDPPSVLSDEGTVFLEDLDLTASPCEVTAKWAEQLALWAFNDEADWRTAFRQRFVVLPDDAFNFLCETGTEVQPHVRIEDDFKRVADGQLWYEESLPAESLLAGLVWCDALVRDPDQRGKLLTEFATRAETLQIGGKATVGKGRVRCSFTERG